MRKAWTIVSGIEPNFALAAILNIEVNAGQPYKTAREIIAAGGKIPRGFGMRTKLGSMAERLEPEWVLVIDPKSDAICAAVGVDAEKVKTALRMHPAYMGAHTASIDGRSVSGMYFHVEILREMGALGGKAEAESSADDDVKFGE